MSRRARLLLAYLPAIAWYGLLWWLSSQPNLPGPGDQSWRDFLWFKTAHMMVYAVLASLIWQANRGVLSKVWRPKIWLVAWLFILVLAAVDEFHQSFVPGRTARLTDVGIDLIGSGAALLFLERYNAKRSHPRDSRSKHGM